MGAAQRGEGTMVHGDRWLYGLHYMEQAFLGGASCNGLGTSIVGFIGGTMRIRAEM